jgi:hypothetical protein
MRKIFFVFALFVGSFLQAQDSASDPLDFGGVQYANAKKLAESLSHLGKPSFVGETFERIQLDCDPMPMSQIRMVLILIRTPPGRKLWLKVWFEYSVDEKEWHLVGAHIFRTTQKASFNFGDYSKFVQRPVACPAQAANRNF